MCLVENLMGVIVLLNCSNSYFILEERFVKHNGVAIAWVNGIIFSVIISLLVSQNAGISQVVPWGSH